MLSNPHLSYLPCFYCKIFFEFSRRFVNLIDVPDKLEVLIAVYQVTIGGVPVAVWKNQEGPPPPQAGDARPW